MYKEGPPGFKPASPVPGGSITASTFPWILTGGGPAFLASPAGGVLEQPPKARLRTRRPKMCALRFIRHVLDFETFTSESEAITGHARRQCRFWVSRTIQSRKLDACQAAFPAQATGTALSDGRKAMVGPPLAGIKAGHIIASQ